MRGRAVGICCLTHLDHSGVIWSTRPTFVVQPVETGGTLPVTVITEYILHRRTKIESVQHEPKQRRQQKSRHKQLERKQQHSMKLNDQKKPTNHPKNKRANEFEANNWAYHQDRSKVAIVKRKLQMFDGAFLIVIMTMNFFYFFIFGLEKGPRELLAEWRLEPKTIPFLNERWFYVQATCTSTTRLRLNWNWLIKLSLYRLGYLIKTNISEKNMLCIIKLHLG